MEWTASGGRKLPMLEASNLDDNLAGVLVEGGCESVLGLCDCDTKSQTDFSVSLEVGSRAGILILSLPGAKAPVLLHYLNVLALVQHSCWALAML